MLISCRKTKDILWASKLYPVLAVSVFLQLSEGDEVDIIKGASITNPNFLTVSRVVIMKIGGYDEDAEKFVVKLRKFPNLLIEKYDDFQQED